MVTPKKTWHLMDTFNGHFRVPRVLLISNIGKLFAQNTKLSSEI